MNSNDCVATKCANGFAWNTTTLNCQPTTGYGLVDTSDDILGGISNNLSTSTTCGPGDGQWTYSYYGNLTGSNIITFSDVNGITLPHYQIRVIFWMILIDNWQGSDIIKATLQGNQTKTQNRNSRQTN